MALYALSIVGLLWLYVFGYVKLTRNGNIAEVDKDTYMLFSLIPWLNTIFLLVLIIAVLLEDTIKEKITDKGEPREVESYGDYNHQDYINSNKPKEDASALDS